MYLRGCSVALTEAWLKANNKKSREKVEEKTDRDGMSVRVSPKGKIVYQVRYYFDGKQSRVDLGSYPVMSLKEARDECFQVRSMLENGRNPKIERLKMKRVRTTTYETLFLDWYQAYCVKNKTQHREILRSFEIYVFPLLGQRDHDDISVTEWMELLDRVAGQYPQIGARILVNAKQVSKWANIRGMVKQDVLVNISAKNDLGVDKGEVERVLSDDELRLVWLAINRSRMAPKNKIFLKLCLAYGCRNGELRTARIDHFDLDAGIWTVPVELNKTGKTTKKKIVRPIIPEFMPLITEALTLGRGGEYLFENTGTKEPMGRRAPLSLPYNIMQYLRRNENYEMEHWTVHDLRRTARTNFSTLTQPHIAEIMLGHALPKIWRVYDKYDYLEEQVIAYKKWWERLQRIVEV